MADFCTLEEAKAWAGITVDTENAVITSIIAAVTNAFQTFTHRDILQGTYQEKYSGTGQKTLRLKQYPITAISSLKIDGVIIPAAASSQGAGFMFDQEWIYVYGYLFTQGFLNVEVNYTAGYATPPPELNIAAREQVQYQYFRKARTGEASRNLGGQTVTFESTDLLQAVALKLESYRRKL